MLGGYMGKILRVDLTSGKIAEEELPSEDTLREYLGCFGLGLRLLYDMLPSGFSASDGENPLIFLAGPLTGTHMPSSNNLTLITKNFDTNFTVGRSHTHGFLAPNLKFSGYDGLIITGKAEKPVYIWINNGKTEIRDALKFWGKDTHQTEELLKVELGQPKASVAAIGPAGENLCAGALIANDKNHSMSHSGVGAVMGSKKLKAIAVFGTNEVPIADSEKEKRIAQRWLKDIDKYHISYRIRRGGIPRDDYRTILSAVGVAAMNMQTTQLPGFGVGMSQQKITPQSCYRCPIACTYDVEVLSGPHKGYVATLAGGGESMEGSAALVGITEPGTIFYLTDLYDRLGIETSTIGCAISMAFEAYEKGLITSKDTGGLELKWGDAEVVEQMIKKCVYREGIGDILARGPKEAAEVIGGDAPDFAIHIKGAGMNLHDWRAAWGFLLGQILGGGSGWPAPGADALRVEPDAGYPELTDPFNSIAKAEELARTGPLKYLADCTGICWFVSWSMPEILNITAEALSAVVGWDCTPEELHRLGERVISLERAFNVRHGLTPADDYNVSKRITEAPGDGPARGKSIRPHLRGMINDYYKLMGWDEETGKPRRQTLLKLGLEDVAKDLWG